MMRYCWLFAVVLAVAVDAFVVPTTAFTTHVLPNKHSHHSHTRLFAIGVLARKAKEANVRKYCEAGVEDEVMEQYKKMKKVLEEQQGGDSADTTNTIGPLQTTLTKRKGTITVIAEYKRKLQDSSGYIDEVFDPEILSPSFREFGASAIAVMADEAMGGCTYEDIRKFVQEQARAKREVPGPLLVINNDLMVDEIQMAQSAAYGASAVVLNMNVIGSDKVQELLQAAKALELEVIVAVSTHEEAQDAIDVGARILSVVGGGTVDEKEAILANLNIPDEGAPICKIANIYTRGNQEFEEIEEAWQCRDKGFNCVWVSDALYKGGSSAVEHPGAVIQAMRSKSSTKWASPKARSGKGEGAREYLGDILM